MGSSGPHLNDIDGPIYTEAVIWKFNCFALIPYCGGSLGSLLVPCWRVHVTPGFSRSLTSAFFCPPVTLPQCRSKFPVLLSTSFVSTLLFYNETSFHFFILFFISLLMITSLCALVLCSHLSKKKKKTTHLRFSFRIPIWISHLIWRIAFVWATRTCLNSWGQIGDSSAFGVICALSSRMNSYLAGNNVGASEEENGHRVPRCLVDGHFRLPQFSDT